MAGSTSGASVVGQHPTIANLYPVLTDSYNSELILFAYCTGTPDTTANTYQHGCLMIQTDSGTGTQAVWENVGSSAVPSWNKVGAISAGEITLAEGKILIGNAGGTAVANAGYFDVATDTNGVTEVNVFGTTNGIRGTITSVQAIAKDDTSGTITLAGTGGTVASFLKGSAGVVTGATAVANTGFGPTGTLTVVSSTTGNATVRATFITGA